jgi:Ca-activated chloride channel homolog
MTQIVIITDEEMDKLAATENEGLGGLQSDKGPLPLKALDVRARLEGLLSEVSVTQVFVNTHAVPVEATYIFPLPDRAAVTGFRMEVGDRVIDGVLEERASARRNYEEAIQAGHRAAITEEERPGVFTLRVGNLPPGESATVRLTLVGHLVYDAGEVTFRFPLVVAPRYIPGTPLPGTGVGSGVAVDTDAVPDASRITPPVMLPGYPNPVRFSLTADVDSLQLPTRDFRSNLHSIAIELRDSGVTRIAVQPGERLNRDFILRYRIAEESVKTSLTLVPDVAGSEGTFVLNVVPPVDFSTAPSRPTRRRDVIFVLDRSGSMGGWKMVAARRALGRMIDSLTNRDCFAVLAFDDEVETPVLCSEGLVAASDRNRFRVIEWLATLDARGGTELAQPLAQAAAQLAEKQTNGTDRVLVLLTDGQVGNEDQILRALVKELKGIRVFTLGIDQAVNETFLRRLAALGGGSCDLVESEDRLDEVMAKVQRRIGSPLLTDLRLEPAHLTLDSGSQVPARLPDLFPEVPLMVLGRYRGSAEGGMVLHSTDDAGQPARLVIEGQVSCNSALTRTWARGRLRDLEDRLVVGEHDAPAELQKSIVELSLKYGVLCRFTAFAAIDRSEKVAPGTQRQIIQPVEMPTRWELDVALASAGVARGGPFKSMFQCMVRPGSLPPMAFCSAPSDSAEELDESESLEMTPEQEGFDDGVDDAALALGAPPASGPALSHDDDVDLTAYRERALEILEAFRADKSPVHALGVLLVRLRALVEDLKSIGASEAAVEPLATLLQQFSGPGSQLHQVIPDLLARTEEVLDSFARAIFFNLRG